MHDPVGFSTVLLRNAVGTLPKDLAGVFTTVTTNDGDSVVVQIFFADQWEIKPCGVITHERLGFVGENTATSALQMIDEALRQILGTGSKAVLGGVARIAVRILV